MVRMGFSARSSRHHALMTASDTHSVAGGSSLCGRRFGLTDEDC